MKHSPSYLKQHHDKTVGTGWIFYKDCSDAVLDKAGLRLWSLNPDGTPKQCITASKLRLLCNMSENLLAYSLQYQTKTFIHNCPRVSVFCLF